MIAQHTGIGRANSKTIERWTVYLQERIPARFQRPEVRDRAYRYLTGLLGEVGARTLGRWPKPSARRAARGATPP